jgi:hypothetical protein
MEYWRNYREPTPSVTIRQEPSYGSAISTTLRSSYKKLSVSQVHSMPNVSIRKKTKLGFYGHSTINHDYNLKAINGDKVVVDNATGLMWHQGGSDKMSWNEAKKWIKKLNKKRSWLNKKDSYAGYQDWRLPTVEEAASLLESSEKYVGLSIDPVFSRKQIVFWTGDRGAGGKYGPEIVWIVNVCADRGRVVGINNAGRELILRWHVRPVRSMR